MEDRSEVVFVNAVEQTGFNNGIFNVAFSTARFTPTTDSAGSAASAINPYISANLRMDLFCVQQLHGILSDILAQQTKPAAKPSEVN